MLKRNQSSRDFDFSPQVYVALGQSDTCGVDPTECQNMIGPNSICYPNNNFPYDANSYGCPYSTPDEVCGPDCTCCRRADICPDKNKCTESRTGAKCYTGTPPDPNLECDATGGDSCGGGECTCCWPIDTEQKCHDITCSVLKPGNITNSFTFVADKQSIHHFYRGNS